MKSTVVIKSRIVMCVLFISFFVFITTESIAGELDFSANMEYSFGYQDGKSSPGEIFSSMNNYSGLAYSPFESNSFQQGLSGPVLYGPGGDPIGGLPVGDGIIFMFLAALSYCCSKVMQKRKSHKI